MELYRQLCAFVDQNCEHGGAAVDYSEYIRQDVGSYGSLFQEARNMDDLVSVIGWDTTADGVQSLVYASLLGGLSHAVRLNYDAGIQTMLHKHNYVELFGIYYEKRRMGIK